MKLKVKLSVALFTVAFSIPSFACDVQLRTYDKHASPTDEFFSVGDTSIELEQGREVDLYVQFKSRSQYPYLMKGDVYVSSGSAVTQTGQTEKYGSVTIRADNVGTSYIRYTLYGREDGGSVNISGCETGTISVTVKPSIALFDIVLAQNEVRDLSSFAQTASSLVQSETSDFYARQALLDLLSDIRNLNTAIVSSGGDSRYVVSELSAVEYSLSAAQSETIRLSSRVSRQLDRVEQQLVYVRSALGL